MIDNPKGLILDRSPVEEMEDPLRMKLLRLERQIARRLSSLVILL